MNATPVLRAEALVAVALLMALSVACSSASATATLQPTATQKLTATPTGYLSSIGRRFLRAVKEQQFDQAKALLCPEIQDELGRFTADLTRALADFDADLEISSCFKKPSEQFSVLCGIEPPNTVHRIDVYFNIEDGKICDWEVWMIEREIETSPE